MVHMNRVHMRRKTSEPWFPKRRSSEIQRQRASLSRRKSSALVVAPALPDTTPKWKFWSVNFKLRSWDDDDETSWWFAGTAVPLLSAALGPLANVMSIAALVTSWRMCLVEGQDSSQCTYDGDSSTLVSDLAGNPFADPHWCYALNAFSLALGFVGNFFLLLNFTGRVRYIIALPVTIFMWYTATAILIALTVSMNNYVPPIRPQETYTQGFWYGVLAAIVYCVCSMLLMVNMLGYFLGHYPQNFNLTESQRTLILQSMMFFIWLGGGAAVFSTIESRYGNGKFDWSFTNALYFCDVSILTIGFGDIYVTTDVSRGLLLPYSIGGIISLGLVISSISYFAAEMGSDNIIQKHIDKSRSRTFDRSIADTAELQRRTTMQLESGQRPSISAPFNPVRHTALTIEDDKQAAKDDARHKGFAPMHALKRTATTLGYATAKPFMPNVKKDPKSRLVILKEEKDRFDAMREIQSSTQRFKKWFSLTMSVIAFGMLWCLGAVVFWRAEQSTQGLTYFEALYFCYVSLLTVGYGDLAPQSNVGRPFFVIWSLIAVPTMTILVSDMGDTIIKSFKSYTAVLGDFTVLPKEGVWRQFLERHRWLLNKLQAYKEKREVEQRRKRGFQAGPDPEDDSALTLHPTLETLAAEENTKPTDLELARRLAQAIRKTATDMKSMPPKRYGYEEWVEYTQLIRFTRTKSHHMDGDLTAEEEEEEDLIEWDWIGEDSPMMARQSEPEFVLDRLCESMGRYIRNSAAHLEGLTAGLKKRDAAEDHSPDVAGTTLGSMAEGDVGHVRSADEDMSQEMDFAKDFTFGPPSQSSRRKRSSIKDNESMRKPMAYRSSSAVGQMRDQ